MKKLCSMILAFALIMVSLSTTAFAANKAVLNGTKIALRCGSTFRIKVTGGVAQSYSSTNSNICTVSSRGLVTAKRAGNCTIKVKIRNSKSMLTCSINSYGDYAEGLKAASGANRLLIVKGSGTTAKVSLHVKRNGHWSQSWECDGNIGANGLGKTHEGDKKTPIGTYKIIKAFGIKSNPGCGISYTKVNSSHYWVDDSNSKYYNKFVSTNNVKKDWRSAEHIVDKTPVYNYVLATDYNSACKAGKGSGIFVHVTRGNSTLGCIAIPESYMKKLVKATTSSTKVVIANGEDVMKY